MMNVGTEEQNVEVYENDIEMYLKLFCEQENIADLKKETQSVWNAALRFVHKHVFKNKQTLKQKNIIDNPNPNATIQSNYNAYDYDNLMEILDIYIYYCHLYDKAIAITGFSILTGINDSIIHGWGSGDRGKLSSLSAEIYKKLRTGREASLSDKLLSGKVNPVGILGVLNHENNWNMPGVRNERNDSPQLTSDNLPKLCENGSQLAIEKGE